MAIRGAEEKKYVTDVILNAFDKAFVHGKEIRIPVGEMQIKVTLTAAKDIVSDISESADSVETKGDTVDLTPPSAEEMNDVSHLLSALGKL